MIDDRQIDRQENEGEEKRLLTVEFPLISELLVIVLWLQKMLTFERFDEGSQELFQFGNFFVNLKLFQDEEFKNQDDLNNKV